MNMLIESVSPELVGAKSTLPAIRGWPDAERETLLAVVPAELLACECFHDKLTRLWRYGFGEPHQVGSELVWGIHMWPPVPVLFDVLACALRGQGPSARKISGASPGDSFVLRNNFAGLLSIAAA